MNSDSAFLTARSNWLLLTASDICKQKEHVSLIAARRFALKIKWQKQASRVKGLGLMRHPDNTSPISLLTKRISLKRVYFNISAIPEIKFQLG